MNKITGPWQWFMDLR